MYQIQLYDNNCSPICDGVIRFFVDDLGSFEKNWLSHLDYATPEDADYETVARYMKSKAGAIVTDYYSDDEKLNIVQEKSVEIITEKSYTESDVTKVIENAYGCPSTYHMDKVTYHIRFIRSEDGELLKLCRYDIRGICYDTGESYWTGVDKDKYAAIGFDAFKKLANEEYLPSYLLFENDRCVAHYCPRYKHVTVYGNPFVDLTNHARLYSDQTEDYSSVEASLYVWHVLKNFETEQELEDNIKNYRLEKSETQRLLMDFPGEAG